jgi:hypothetical protein
MNLKTQKQVKTAKSFSGVEEVRAWCEEYLDK